MGYFIYLFLMVGEFFMIHLDCSFKRIWDAYILKCMYFIIALVYFEMNIVENVFSLCAFKMQVFEIKKIIL